MTASGEVAVIRGWGAAPLLEPIPHVVHVCAPFDMRAQRMMERLDTGDRAFAEKEIRLAEEAITAITRCHFDTNDVSGAHATLSGIIENDAALKPAADIAAAVPGVTGVTNALKSTRRAHRRLSS